MYIKEDTNLKEQFNSTISRWSLKTSKIPYTAKTNKLQGLSMHTKSLFMKRIKESVDFSDYVIYELLKRVKRTKQLLNPTKQDLSIKIQSPIQNISMYNFIILFLVKEQKKKIKIMAFNTRKDSIKSLKKQRNYNQPQTLITGIT